MKILDIGMTVMLRLLLLTTTISYFITIQGVLLHIIVHHQKLRVALSEVLIIAHQTSLRD